MAISTPGLPALEDADLGRRPRKSGSVHRLPALAPASLGSARKSLVSVGMRPVNALETVGRAAKLFAEVVRYSVTDTISGRLPVGELVNQAWQLYKVTALPAILMAIPFGGMVAVQISGLINQVGANSLVGAASGVGIVRQGAPITAGLLMGGAAASAIASDLGARAIREELDALRVMGVNPVRHLVVPRFLGVDSAGASLVRDHHRVVGSRVVPPFTHRQ